jgi:structural maintenance of chromosome 1
MIQRHLLWKLYHISQEIANSAEKVEEANTKLESLRTSVVSWLGPSSR